jgi:hypothetical protein
LPYLTSVDAKNAIQGLKSFHGDLVGLFEKHGMSLESNSGRRNVILSQAQEEFFARELAKRYKDVVADGKTGMPDIFIGEIGTELECKLTSPLKDGGLNLQADEYSVSDESPKDFLYVVTKDMKEFAVLHFVGLQKSDFIVSNSSRSKGKMRLSKSRAFGKCNVLLGDVENRTEKMLSQAKLDLSNVSPKAKKSRERIEKRIEYWRNSENTYTVHLVEL